MATKTANVTARIQPNIKEQAEAILERLGTVSYTHLQIYIILLLNPMYLQKKN